MKFGYKFSNLLGTVYHKGNIEFSNDGNTILSPVGNRISLFDLKNNKSETLSVSTKHNIACIAISPDGFTAILVDTEGEATLISLVSKSVLYRHHFHKRIRCIKFSPDGKKFAVTKDNLVHVYYSPGKTRELNSFTLYRTYFGAYNDTACIDWTSDSTAFAVGSLDGNTRIYAAMKLKNLSMYSLGGHKDEIVGCFFEKNSLDLYSISRDGVLNVWECDSDLKELEKSPTEVIISYHEESSNKSEEANTEQENTKHNSQQEKILYKKVGKFFINKEGDFNNVTCVSYHKDSHILMIGLASGAFHIHELPQFNLIHSLSIGEHQVTSSSFNATGDWLAIASSGMGQLLVWEWQSESYVMKQQGHFNAMTSLDYSPDGRFIVTGGEDGKVKIWNTSSGFCFVTFTEHSAGVTSVKFTSSGYVVLSASLDGTVRAFDLHRYRNFRTFTSPRPTQFSCLSSEVSGELVSAASHDTFEVFVWSVRTGRLLEVLAGHQAPIYGLAFSPTESVLASGSWDQTVILWKVGSEKKLKETMNIGHEVLDVTFRSDGKEIAVSSLNSEISFWNPQLATQLGSIDCKLDIGGGRGDLDRISAKTSSSGKAYESLCYTADGKAIIAGGRTKNVCIYHVKETMLMKKFQVTCNLSFDAVEEFLDKRKMTEFGPSALIDVDDDERGSTLPLPGVKSNDMSSRAFKPEIRVPCIRFSPTGREWAAVSTEGILVYSLDSNLIFDPFDLDISVTPKNIMKTLEKKEYGTAIIMSFQLNEKNIITEVIESISSKEIEVIVPGLPQVYVEKLLEFIAGQLESSPHFQFYLVWCSQLLVKHGPALKQRSSNVVAVIRHLHKSLTSSSEKVIKLCDTNYYQMQYIIALAKLTSISMPEDVMEIDNKII